MIYRLLADLVLLTHFLFVVVVIAGLPLIIIGGIRGWHWVRSPLSSAAKTGLPRCLAKPTLERSAEF